MSTRQTNEDMSKIEKTNWLIEGIEYPLKCTGQIRYQAKPVEIKLSENGAVEFSEPQRAVTSGQSLVFYENNQVLGGGIIK